MAQPINHDTGSSIATGTWEAGKGAVIGASILPIAGAVLGALVVGGLSAIVLPAGLPVLGAALAGAIAGGLGTGALALTVGAPLTAAIAAFGGLLGLGRGADRISQEKAAFQSKVMANERFNDTQRSMAENAGLQQGYQVGFQEGQQFAVQQIQQELQQQAQQQMMMQQQQNTMMGQAPVEGHHAQKVLAQRGGHHASKADMVAHQKEQAAEATPHVG